MKKTLIDALNCLQHIFEAELLQTHSMEEPKLLRKFEEKNGREVIIQLFNHKSKEIQYMAYKFYDNWFAI